MKARRRGTAKGRTAADAVNKEDVSRDAAAAETAAPSRQSRRDQGRGRSRHARQRSPWLGPLRVPAFRLSITSESVRDIVPPVAPAKVGVQGFY